MATSLFDKIIFGPIKSRRLGVSLGVNLLPIDGKLCNFDCIYCECGWNSQSKGVKLRFNDEKDVISTLELQLKKMAENGEHLDVITFAGNGEPTMHPNFKSIIEHTIECRNRYFPKAKVAVLSNATMMGRKEVAEALELVDRAILKIDSAFNESVNAINQPTFNYSIDTVVENLKRFKGEIIIQTMFLRGEHNGVKIDNTTSEEVGSWLEIIKKINPKEVMIYSLDRDTPASNLEKVSLEELQKIAIFVEVLGIKCMAA
ncbi:MAG: radical SAM protein [Rikenellaceae bacterium]